jgi:hypothetical protein
MVSAGEMRYGIAPIQKAGGPGLGRRGIRVAEIAERGRDTPMVSAGETRYDLALTQTLQNIHGIVGCRFST